MDDEAHESEMQAEDPEVSDRREFLRSLGKWSAAAIAAILFSESMPANDVAGWMNRRGSWINGAGRGGTWINGGGDWINRGGGGWLNSRGGGGGWVNRRSW
jgi:hypothetical protein